MGLVRWGRLGEQGNAGRIPMNEILSSNRSNFAGGKKPRHGNTSSSLLDRADVMVGLGKKPSPPTVTAKQKGTFGHLLGEV